MRRTTSYRELDAWLTARELVKAGYALVRGLPPDERYVIGTQLRRALHAVPSNIAEGNGRGTRKDYVRFLTYARGSLAEVDSLVFGLDDLGFYDRRALAPVRKLIVRVGQLLNALIGALRRSRSTIPVDATASVTESRVPNPESRGADSRTAANTATANTT